MRLQYFLPLVSLLTLSSSTPIPDSSYTTPIPNNPYPGQNTACANYCSGTLYNQSAIHQYICGDPRLGPVKLPTHLPLEGLFETYDRFGGLCPGPFLTKWYNSTAGSYIYPPQNGFQLDVNGSTIQGTVTLPVGLLIDRFGSEYGTFVSPQGAPYTQRALPPSNLDTNPADPRYPYNYHVYNITKEFTSSSGPIATWFGQPGQGVQYQLSTNIMNLLNGGYIERINLRNY